MIVDGKDLNILEVVLLIAEDLHKTGVMSKESLEEIKESCKEEVELDSTGMSSADLKHRCLIKSRKTLEEFKMKCLGVTKED